ncbi:conserved hypothetical protein [Sphingomonas sp. EC-HK361]|nr:conserved hypothetical protein [Sphingomonas sp. EC-HK361]
MTRGGALARGESVEVGRPAGHARERAGPSPPPKEQPPRNLSGRRDRARQDTLESGRAFQARPTEGVSRSGDPARSKLSGPVTEGVRVCPAPVVPCVRPFDERPAP